MNTFALRLKPYQDLRRELEAFAAARQMRAGLVLTCVGSLTQAALRLANAEWHIIYLPSCRGKSLAHQRKTGRISSRKKIYEKGSIHKRRIKWAYYLGSSLV
ncbi:MAG: DUF296 domain-containing protein [Anaerolineales bacterium]|jgi:hypothetical protein